MFLKSHDPGYWSARALDAQYRAERCQGDCVRRSLLLELAGDYSWLADRVRPCALASNVLVPKTVTPSPPENTHAIGAITPK
jgi:hypothetical protein